MIEKAEKHLRKRLARERHAYGMIGIPNKFVGEPAAFVGKGERFEFWVEFNEGMPRVFEVTVYGGGRSFKVYEL